MEARTQSHYDALKHGDLPRWRRLVDALPALTPSVTRLDGRQVEIGMAADGSLDERRQLSQALSALKPWRKGPFALFGLDLDAEWRCDLKWSRLQDKIAPLPGRCVLDVGCGNGYFGWRMLGGGAAAVVGLEPVLRYLTQFFIVKRYLPERPLALLPFRLDELRGGERRFDTAFSMGVLYHHPEPRSHLRQLWDSLRPGGELVLESLIVGDGHADGLRPAGSYACMKNVSIIPHVDQVAAWLAAAGFRDAALRDVTPTKPREQRVTAWSGDRSLADFLDADDDSLTVEGHPAPTRALWTAVR